MNRLVNLPPEIFCSIWEHTDVTDYIQIVDLIAKFPEIKSNLYTSLSKITIDGRGTIARNLESTLNTIKKELPRVKITLVNISFVDFETLYKIVRVYPQIQNLINVPMIVDRHLSVTYVNFDTELLILKIMNQVKENHVLNTSVIKISFIYYGNSNNDSTDSIYEFKYENDSLIYNVSNIEIDYYENQQMSALINWYNYLKPKMLISEFMLERNILLLPIKHLHLIYSDRTHNDIHSIAQNLGSYIDSNDLSYIDNKGILYRDTSTERVTFKLVSDRLGTGASSISKFFFSIYGESSYPNIVINEVPIYLRDLNAVMNVLPNVKTFYIYDTNAGKLKEKQLLYPNIKLVPVPASK